MKTKTTYFPSLEAVRSAQTQLKGLVSTTPLMENRNISTFFGAHVYLKREDLQMVRSYKIRGALNKLLSTDAEQLKQGVVCASAGNHAQGVAHGCALLGHSATIFMPVTTPKQKLDQVRMFGGSHVTIELVGDTFDEAYHAAIACAKDNNACFIPPFEDPKVIEGQGTVGLEILDQLDAPDYVVMPVGGGGLAAGLSTVLKTLSPKTKLIGVEPKGAPSLTVSLANGKNTMLTSMDKFVDGAAVAKMGDLNFEICRENLDRVLTVAEGQVCETILALYNKDAIVAEPAGALSVAALHQLRDEIKGKKVVCVLSGGNNDITRMEEMKERALVHKGVKHYFLVNFPQRVGALKEFVMDVLGPNDDIHHFEYTKKHSREKGSAVVGLHLQSKEELPKLIAKMKAHGFFGEHLSPDHPAYSYIS